MLDRILAATSLAALIAFMAIVLLWINELDLWIITVLVLALAVYDFVQSTRNTTNNSKE